MSRSAEKTRERARDGVLLSQEGEPAVFYRAMDVRLIPRTPGAGRAEGEPDEERLELALSSESPVERYDWWSGERYQEVLDHAPGAIDLSYAKDGLPFLLHHDTREMIGLLEDVRVDDDRRIRGAVRFSRAARAQEIRQDILDGIRKKVSVGYRLTDDYEQIAGENGAIPTRRYRNWRPMEGSSVPIPADYDVGIGRSADGAARRIPQSPSIKTASEARSQTMSTVDTPAHTGADTRAIVNDPAIETKRATDILALAETHKIPFGRARAWISEGKTADQVAAEILGGYRSGEINVTPPTPGAALTLTEKEEKQYSICRAINALVNGQRSGFEFEISDALAKSTGKQTRGLLVPTTLRANIPGGATAEQALEIAKRYDPSLAMRTLLSVGTATKGPESKFTEYAGFIDLLRARARIFDLGAQMLPGLQGDPGFVEQTGTGTATWGAETANAALTSLTLGLRTMTPKVLQSATSYTRQLLAQSVLAVEGLVRLDIATLHALAIDLAAINGSGAGSQPRGILQTAGIGSVAGGTNGAQPNYDNAVQLQREVAIDNAFFGGLAYLTTPGIAARWMLTQKFATTNGDPVWAGNMLDGQVAGFKATASTQVPSTLTKGTAVGVCHAIVFGDFSQLLVGEWGAMEVLVDPLTQGPAVVKVMSIQMVDVFIRYAAAFAAMQDALQ